MKKWFIKWKTPYLLSGYGVFIDIGNYEFPIDWMPF